MKKMFWGLLAFCLFFGGALEARTIYVTRHGQVGDKKFRDARIKEPKLTDLGVEQSEMLAKYLAETAKFKGTILVSPLYRTIQTGAPTAKALGVKLTLDPGFQEIATHPVPTPRGMTLEEIEKRFPGATEAGPNFKDGWRLCNEDAEMRFKRVASALDRALENYSGDILIVTHAGIANTVVEVMNSRRAENKGRKFRGMPWNCYLYVFEIDDRGKVVSGKYITSHIPDEKLTDNFRCPKIERPDDPRYRTRAQQKAINEKRRREAERKKLESK